MTDGSFPVFGGNGITGHHNEFNTEKPTIVIGRVGYYCGSIHLTPEKAWITDNAFFTIYDEKRLYQNFVIWLLKAINLQEDTSSTAQPVISGGKIYSIPIPLPPLNEQRRIVAKIDQLMARCDELEKLRKARDRTRIKVHMAACDRLLTAPDTDTFTQSWQFITQHFSELYSVRENVAELRKAILQIAIVGKISRQEASDQPASELVEQIEEKKRYLAVGGKGKKLKRMKEIRTEDIPCAIPKTWKWVRLGNLIELVSGQHLRPNEYNQDGIGFSYYTGPADFGEESPTPTRWTTVDRSIAIEGDILLTVKGAGVGKTNILAEEKAAISRVHPSFAMSIITHAV